MTKKRENIAHKKLWIESEAMTKHLLDLSMCVNFDPATILDPYFRHELEYIHLSSTQNESEEICQTSDWHLEAIFHSFLYHTWAHPWGRIVRHHSGFSFSRNAVADLTPSAIPYFLLPVECAHCQNPFFKKGDYNPTGKASWYCNSCPKESADNFNKLRDNVNRVLERFSNQRERVSQAEMFGELMTAYGSLWNYINRPYTPRYMLVEPFEKVELAWLYELYRGEQVSLAHVGTKVEAPLFPENPPELIKSTDYYSRKAREELDAKKEKLLNRKMFEGAGLAFPWELSLEALDFYVDPILSRNI